MDTSLLGILMGLSTAVAWAIASVVHTEIARQIGIPNVLLVRQPLACVVLTLCLSIYGFPPLPSAEILFYAVISGIMGIVVGDALFYYAALRIGLTIVEVIQSFAACMTLLLGVLLLGETITFRASMGILLISLAVLLVVISEGKRTSIGSRKTLYVGIAVSFGVAFCIALSLIFAKKALAGVEPLSLALIRNLGAACTIFLVTGLSGRSLNLFRVLNTNRQTIKLFAIGCVCGPAGGIWMSCMAVQLLPTAIASSLIGLQPVFLLCIVSLLERRLPRVLSLIGVLLAAYGVSLCV